MVTMSIPVNPSPSVAIRRMSKLVVPVSSGRDTLVEVPIPAPVFHVVDPLVRHDHVRAPPES